MQENAVKTWLVTGGAGFIGGNFVLEAVASGVHDGGVTHADAEHEAARIGFGQGPLSRSHGHRVTSSDVGDPGADDQLPAGAQQQPGVGQRLPPEDLPGPQRAPAQLLQLGDRLPELVGGIDADAASKWPGRSATRAGRADTISLPGGSSSASI